jgi:hypothetical protein
MTRSRFNDKLSPKTFADQASASLLAELIGSNLSWLDQRPSEGG